ncbi:MAG: DUF5681 domain-containing protein [Rhodoferax sp.]
MPRSSTSFKKGQSGNPAGKQPGTTSRARFRKLVDTDLPGIVQTLVANAKAGDTQAAKVLLDRLIPALKPTTDALSIKTTGTLAERGEALIEAMTSGKVSPDQANIAMNTFTAQAKLVEQSELVQRIEQLEALICTTAKP